MTSFQNGKDLVQEVAKLRRSLDDAEGVSRDTKKEWAHLRSRNITLEEMNVSRIYTYTHIYGVCNSIVNNIKFIEVAGCPHLDS